MQILSKNYCIPISKKLPLGKKGIKLTNKIKEPRIMKLFLLLRNLTNEKIKK